MALSNSLDLGTADNVKLSLSDEINLYQKETVKPKKILKSAEDNEVIEIHIENEDSVIKEEPIGNYSLLSNSVDLSEINFAEKLLQYSQCEQYGSQSKQRRKSATRRRRSSTADHPYICTECISSFTSKGNLRFHIKTVHEKALSFPCPKCDSVFSQKGNYKTHFNSVHLQIRPFECLICEAVFSQKGNLKTHLNKMHYSETNTSDPSSLMKSPVSKKRGRPPTISVKNLSNI